MMRPPSYAHSELLSRVKKQCKSYSTTDGSEFSADLAAASPRAKMKKTSKNSSKYEDKQLPLFEHMDNRNLPSEYGVDSSRPHSGQH